MTCSRLEWTVHKITKKLGLWITPRRVCKKANAYIVHFAEIQNEARLEFARKTIQQAQS